MHRLHTYINDHYNPSVRIIDLVSHITLLCVLILYISSGIYSLKLTPNNRFFWETFHNNFYLLSEFLPEIYWGSNPDFSSNKPTHYLLDHGDFTCIDELNSIFGDETPANASVCRWYGKFNRGHCKTNFVKVVQNQLLFQKPLMLCTNWYCKIITWPIVRLR